MKMGERPPGRLLIIGENGVSSNMAAIDLPAPAVTLGVLGELEMADLYVTAAGITLSERGPGHKALSLASRRADDRARNHGRPI